jgi:hypothetical protein
MPGPQIISPSEQLDTLQKLFNRARYAAPEQMGVIRRDVTAAFRALSACVGIEPEKTEIDHILDLGECTVPESELVQLLSKVPKDEVASRLDLAGLVWEAASYQLIHLRLLRDHPEQRAGRPAPRDFRGGGLTFDELVAALRHLGYDLTCGQCASVFYTGGGSYPHDATCQTKPLPFPAKLPPPKQTT